MERKAKPIKKERTRLVIAQLLTGSGSSVLLLLLCWPMLIDLSAAVPRTAARQASLVAEVATLPDEVLLLDFIDTLAPFSC
jgi:hypothetical protein